MMQWRLGSVTDMPQQLLLFSTADGDFKADATPSSRMFRTGTGQRNRLQVSAILNGKQSLAIGVIIANVDLAVEQPYVNSCRMCTHGKGRIGQSPYGGLSWQP
jgi:hypothetical protein